MDTFLDSSLFRNIYCNVASVSDNCAARGYSDGFLPDGLQWLAFLVTSIAIIAVVINAVLMGVLGFIWFERRVFARFQNRVGPNRWGPFGMLTPVADAIKTMFKEDVAPEDSDRLLYNLAPVLMAVPLLLVFALIPVGIGTFVVDLNVGILFILAITTMSGLAIVMGAWASGNRLSIFSGLRAVALLISYEIPMALSLVGVLMLAGSLSLGRIVDAQNVPFILVQPMGFFVFFLASLAEMNRTPFDLTEAESELAAGYLNDYSSMKFGLFFLAEFMAALAGAAVITTLFLSGWRGFEPIPSHIWFFLKMGGVLFLIIWIRFTWPRLRIDQMLAFAWKGLFELTLVNLVLAGILIAIWPEPTTTQLWIMAAINWPVFFVTVFAISKVLGVKPHSIERPAAGLPYPVATDEPERPAEAEAK